MCPTRSILSGKIRSGEFLHVSWLCVYITLFFLVNGPFITNYDDIGVIPMANYVKDFEGTPLKHYALVKQMVRENEMNNWILL